MPSTNDRGRRWKARSKQWLERQGYEVAYLEVGRIVFTPDGMIATKKDQFASDLLAMRSGDTDVLFVQVKGGKTARAQLAKARREFAKHQFARCARRIVHVWKPLAREPEVVEC